MQTPYLLQPGGVFQLGGIVFVVDEAVFGEHRGHGGMLEDIISGPLFASILQATSGGDGFMQDVLELFRLARYAAIVNVGLETSSAAGINMDADEQVSTPAIRRLAASAQGRVCIPGAAHFNLNPSRF